MVLGIAAGPEDHNAKGLSCDAIGLEFATIRVYIEKIWHA
jgi:hypothetical protein